MGPDRLDIVISQWARIGLFIGNEVTSATPHLEQLIIDTANVIPSNARLFYACMSWLSAYGFMVNVDQLQRLVVLNLPHEHQPPLAALLALCVKHGVHQPTCCVPQINVMRQSTQDHYFYRINVLKL